MTSDDATEIARALLEASGPRTVFHEAHQAAWAADLERLPGVRYWGIQRPGAIPEAIVLSAHEIYRVAAESLAEGADPAPLITTRYPIDDTMRLFSRLGEWRIESPAVKRPLRLVSGPRRMRTLLRAIWDGLPAPSKGRNPPIV
jgi:hypothetical protein